MNISDMNTLLYFRDFDEATVTDPNARAMIRDLCQEAEVLRPTLIKDGIVIRTFYVVADRGEPSDWMSYENWKEEIAGDWVQDNSHEEYLRHWQAEFPEEKRVYSLTLVVGPEEHVNIWLNNTALIFRINEVHPEEYAPHQARFTRKYTEFFKTELDRAVSMMKAGTYMPYIEDTISLCDRRGYIRRSDYWHAHPEMMELDRENITEPVRLLFDLIAGKRRKNTIPEQSLLPVMTTNIFLEACRIAYTSCSLGSETDDAEALYRKFADGRTGQLFDIDRDDAKAFDELFKGNSGKTEHYYEIFRSGPYMSVQKDRKTGGYYFSISGANRKSRAAAMYMGLRAAGYPVYLFDMEDIADCLAGRDYIGILPRGERHVSTENEYPVKCGAYAHYDPESDEGIKDRITWLPLVECRLEEGGGK